MNTLGTCSECPKLIITGTGRRGGRARKTRGKGCLMKRSRRMATEVVHADVAEATRWWLALTEDQRTAAMAFVRSEPPPYGFRGGKQLWSYFNRAAFSCEQRVVSGVR